jgi:hypothetical protein
MAQSIFTPCEGAIVKVNLCPQGGGGGGGTFNVTVNGAQLGFPTSGFILEMQGNYQFLHALDQFIYYYNFGDRVGELTVSGFGFIGGFVVQRNSARKSLDGSCSRNKFKLG